MKSWRSDIERDYFLALITIGLASVDVLSLSLSPTPTFQTVVGVLKPDCRV